MKFQIKRVETMIAEEEFDTDDLREMLVEFGDLTADEAAKEYTDEVLLEQAGNYGLPDVLSDYVSDKLDRWAEVDVSEQESRKDDTTEWTI